MPFASELLGVLLCGIASAIASCVVVPLSLLVAGAAPGVLAAACHVLSGPSATKNPPPPARHHSLTLEVARAVGWCVVAIVAVPAIVAVLAVLAIVQGVACARRRRWTRKAAAPVAASAARATSALECATRFAAASTEAIVITDPDDGTIVYCNAPWERMCGWTLAEARGRTNRELLQGAGTDMAAAKALGAAVAEGALEARAVLWNYRKNSEGFWNDLTVLQFDRAAEGRPVQVAFLREVENVDVIFDAANGGSVQVAVPVAEEKKREAKAGAFELKRLLAPHVGDYREASLAGLAQ